MKDYHINIFYSDEDEGYIADIPDLVMCSAFGNSPTEALAELELAKEAWLEAAIAEGKAIPEPIYRYSQPDAKLDQPSTERLPSSTTNNAPTSAKRENADAIFANAPTRYQSEAERQRYGEQRFSSTPLYYSYDDDSFESGATTLDQGEQHPEKPDADRAE